MNASPCLAHCWAFLRSPYAVGLHWSMFCTSSWESHSPSQDTTFPGLLYPWLGADALSWIWDGQGLLEIWSTVEITIITNQPQHREKAGPPHPSPLLPLCPKLTKGSQTSTSTCLTYLCLSAPSKFLEDGIDINTVKKEGENDNPPMKKSKNLKTKCTPPPHAPIKPAPAPPAVEVILCRLQTHWILYEWLRVQCACYFAFFLPDFSPCSCYFSLERRVADVFLLLCNYFILFFMGAGDGEIMCQLPGLAHKVEMWVWDHIGSTSSMVWRRVLFPF